MDHTKLYEPSSSLDFKNTTTKDKVEPGELLEDCWFFGNLLDTKTRKMSTSFSDPSTSSTFTKQNLTYEETYESIKKLPKGFAGPSLVKTPSLPPRIERKDRKPTTKISNSDPPKSKKVLSNNLLRSPSLPVSLLGAEEESDHDEDIEFSMGKLIRQASLNSKSNTLPPRTLGTKVQVATPNSSVSKTRSRKKLQEIQWIEEVIRPERFVNRLKPQKSFNDIESRELQGFKDIGFDFEKMNLTPNVRSPVTISLEKQRIQENGTLTKSYVPSAPPVQKWGGKNSSEYVKAQIKFWARAVASNVRQEC